MLVVTIKNNVTKAKCNFLNMNLILERTPFEENFEDVIIERIFGYKFVLRMVYSSKLELL